MLKKFQKALRTDQTHTENLLWFHLRSRRFEGWKFRRQHILQGYIVDFVCLEKKLIIELDGGQHTDQITYDAKRSQILEKDGFMILRFWNHEVLENLEGVLRKILDTPHPPQCGDLSHKGRGEKLGRPIITSATKREVGLQRPTPFTSPLVGEVGPKGRVRGK